jgi:phosphohistidine swiveling domain-containing protein
VVTVELEVVYLPRKKSISGRLFVIDSVKSFDDAYKYVGKKIIYMEHISLSVIPLILSSEAVLFTYGSKYASHAALIAREFDIPLFKVRSPEEIRKYTNKNVVIEDGRMGCIDP